MSTEDNKVHPMKAYAPTEVTESPRTTFLMSDLYSLQGGLSEFQSPMFPLPAMVKTPLSSSSQTRPSPHSPLSTTDASEPGQNARRQRTESKAT